MGIISKLRVTLGLDSSEYKKGLTTAEKQTKTFGNSVKKMGGIIAGYFAFGQIVEGVKYVIRVNKDFEKSLSTLQSITGVTNKELKYYAKAAKFLGETTTQTGVQVSKAFTLIGSKMPQLLKSKEALVEVTKQAIILAEAANIDVPRAAAAMTGALNQMKKGAGEASEFVNILAAGSKLGAADIPYLNEAIEKAGGAAQATGIKFTGLVAAIETVAPSISEPSTAGLQLRQIFLRLQKGADKFNPSIVGLGTALHNMQKEQYTANELLTKFGIINFTAAKALIDGADGFNKFQDGVTGTNTALEQQATNINNLDGDLNQLGSAWEGLILNMQKGGKTLRVMTQGVTTLVRTLSGAGVKLEGLKQAKTAFAGLKKDIEASGGDAVRVLSAKISELENEASLLFKDLDKKKATSGALDAPLDILTGGAWAANAMAGVRVAIEKNLSLRQMLADEQKKIQNKETSDFQASELKRLNIAKLTTSQLEQLYSDDARKFIRSAIEKEQLTRANAAIDAIRNIKNIKKEISALSKEQQTATGNRLISINNEITALKKEISVLKDMKFVAGSIKPIDLTGKGIKKLDKIPLPEFEKQKEATPLKLESSYAKEAQALYLNDLKITQYELNRTMEATAAYGSVMASVSGITSAMGSNTVATFANVASQVISSVSKMIPVLFNQAVGGAVASGAAMPFPMNIAAIASGVAGVVSAFSGIGGGSASTSASPVTKIDTRQYKDPVVNTRRKNTNGMQNIQVEVVGKISNRDIALSAKKGQQQINR